MRMLHARSWLSLDLKLFAVANLHYQLSWVDNTKLFKKLHNRPAHHRVSVAQWKNIGARNPKLWGSIPRGDLEFYLGPALVTRRKTSFFISQPSSKLTISLFLFTTKWSCYTSPPTQHHSFFRNLPLSIILDSWNVKLKLAIHNFSTKLICGTRIYQINVDLLNMYLCCVIVMIS